MITNKTMKIKNIMLFAIVFLLINSISNKTFALPGISKFDVPRGFLIPMTLTIAGSNTSSTSLYAYLTLTRGFESPPDGTLGPLEEVFIKVRVRYHKDFETDIELMPQFTIITGDFNSKWYFDKTISFVIPAGKVGGSVILDFFDTRSTTNKFWQFAGQYAVNCVECPEPPAPTGIIASWPLDGNGNDVSGKDNHATLSNLTSTTDRFGNPTGALYFNGTSGYATVADNIALRLNNTSFTLNYWVKLDSYNASYGSSILSKRTVGANSGWGASITGKLSNPFIGLSTFGPGGGGTNATGTTKVGLNNWHMVTNVYDKQTQQLRIYIDGILNNTTSGILEANKAISAALTIGKDAAGNNYFFKGALDDILIKDTDLSSSEIQGLYNVRRGLIAQWSFDGNGNDVSGNGNNATLNNLTATTDRFGNSQGALYFNGTNGYASVSDKMSLRLNNTDFTINYWIKLDSYHASYGSAILSKRIAGANNGWASSIAGKLSNPIGVVTFGPGGGSTNASGTTLVGLNNWRKITTVYRVSTGQLSIYINGVIDRTTSGILTPNSAISAALTIGRDAAGSNYFLHGALDDIRIYGSALSSSEIQQL